MRSLARIAAGTVGHLWRTSRPLTAVGLLMSAALIASLAGVALDSRTVTGVPAWLKPSKFAASTALYSFTLAWIFGYLGEWRRTRALVGWVTAVVFVLEVAIIDLQAWRGTTSHFNVSTPFDAALFGVMGAAITIQTIAAASVAFALCRQPFADRAMGVALRAGMIITLLGAASGGLMTRPTAAQITEARASRSMSVSGAHTVGAPDGAPGLPGIGWSREHGDLRVGHFVGLHAVQFLPITAVLVSRRRPADAALRVVRVTAFSYAALFALLIAQALRGESIAAPGVGTMTMFGLWAGGTLAASARSMRLGASGGHRIAARV
jgi:hypothetical protein